MNSKIKLYNKDAVDFLSSFKDKSIDMLFADPPYAIGIDYDGYDDTKENLETLVKRFMPEALRVAKVVAITPGVTGQWFYPKPEWVMSFVHPAGIGRCQWGFGCWQPILVYGKDPYLANRKGARPDTYFMKGSTETEKNSEHPCPKPLDLMRWIISRTTFKGQLVVDPFMGSGKTGEAAVQLGRDFQGCDQSEKYVRLAKRNINQRLKEYNMFDLINYDEADSHIQYKIGDI